MTRGLQLSNINIGDRKSVRMSTISESCSVQVPQTPVQRDEGPVNSGGNYDPLKVA